MRDWVVGNLGTLGNIMSSDENKSRSFWDVVGGKRNFDIGHSHSHSHSLSNQVESSPGGETTTPSNSDKRGEVERTDGSNETGSRNVMGVSPYRKSKTKDMSKKTCAICKATFTRSYDVKRHVVQVHGKRSGYPCDLCNLAFSKRVDLNHHIQSVHGSREVFNCPYCRKAFGDMARYRSHVTESHSADNVEQ